MSNPDEMLTLQGQSLGLQKSPRQAWAGEHACTCGGVADRGGPNVYLDRRDEGSNRHIERVFDPSRREKHWGKRKTRARSMKQEAAAVVRGRHRSNWLASRSLDAQPV